VPGPAGQVIDSSQQHAADTAYHNSLVELGKRLLACAKEGDTEGVRQLMSRGAPFTTDWLGTSPLHLTALYNREETCDVLLKAGCSRDARTKVDKTPLHVAAQEGNTTICRLLLEQGADVDAKDMLRMTPLHWAVERGCNSTVEFLLRHGANTNIESKFDKTPLEIASENGRPDIFEMLQKAAEYRVVAIEGEGGMGVSQQEVVQTEEAVFTTKAEANIQYIKSELEALSDGGSLQEIALDPIQIALGESGVSESQDIQVMDEEGVISSQDDALKLLASHGITMLGEQETPVTPNSLSLTEAGKLALFSTSTSNNQSVGQSFSLASRTSLGGVGRPQILNTAPLTAARSSVQTISKPITKVVTLNSKPVAPPSTSGNNKASRVIKLTPAQFAAIKKGKAGQIVLPALSSQGRRETITLRNPSLPAASHVVTRNPSLSFAGSAVGGSRSSGIALASPVPRKVIRLENPSSSTGDKSELAKRLQRELEEKEREKDRYRREIHKREEEADRIKAQLKALSS